MHAMMIVGMQTMVSVFPLIRNPANRKASAPVAGAASRDCARAPARAGWPRRSHCRTSHHGQWNPVSGGWESCGRASYVGFSGDRIWISAGEREDEWGGRTRVGWW